MLVEHYKNPKTKPAAVVALPPPANTNSFIPATGVVIDNPFYRDMAEKRGIDVKEFHRRNDIVRELYRKCPYRSGEIVYPANEDDYKKLGPVIIDKVAYDYICLGNEYEWPATDVPMLLTCHTMKEQDDGKIYNFFATVSYVTRVRPGSVT